MVTEMKTFIVILTALGLILLCHFIAKADEQLARIHYDAGIPDERVGFQQILDSKGQPLMVCVERYGYSDCERSSVYYIRSN